MNFGGIPASATIFLDANILIYHFTNDPLPITFALVESASLLSQQHELLTGDALVVAVMQDQGVNNVASADNDFDGVPGIMRYAPT